MVFQLNLKKNDDEAIGALRSLADHELGAIQHMAAFINFVIKNYHHGDNGNVTSVGPPGGCLLAHGGPTND